MLILYIFIGITIGVLTMWFIYLALRKKSLRQISETDLIAAGIIKEAEKKAKILKKEKILEGKEEWYSQKKVMEDEIKDRQKELRTLEKRSNERLVALDKRLDSLDRKETNLAQAEKRNRKFEDQLNKRADEVEVLIKEQDLKLAEIAGLTREEALKQLEEELIHKAKKHTSGEIRQMIEQLKADATTKSANILATAVQRMAADYVSESTVSVVSLPSDEMKGRIIGREGRNIRSFEKASGVDLIIDDTPEAVVLSCFDPIRREIARLSLEKLISDGRIHPGRIEDIIEKTRKEMDDHLMKVGEKAFLDANVHNISPNIIKLLGRLKYRTSYGQNVLQHSEETAWICGIMAAELGLDQEMARRSGLLHDIGKAIDHEFDGSHAVIGANVARKNGECKIVINAIESHHEDTPPQSVYAVLVQASDAISGARPGARREMLESYMHRLSKLEEIAGSIEGVNKSYAIQAGRELRIIVEPSVVNDDNAAFIAQDISNKIEKEVQYPGTIKVTVIRETRQVSIAK
ncbi:MAG: ribonuclease Y [Candidatus Cloacimonetes bacterium 4572_65]|nr:MAG: ribonuclease Y [Candidatus Cloacimonetes bacterium 4572_65]